MASLVNRDNIMSPDTKMEDNNNISVFRNKRIRSDLNLLKSDKASFLSDLYNFHNARNTPITRFPKINGHEVDLQKLYTEVTNRGGLAKVNNRNQWCEIVKKFMVSPNCVNASVAFKHIYIRFLEKFERQHYLGEDPDKPDEPDDDGRGGRRKSFLPSHMSSTQNAAVNIINLIPMSYNEKQHQVSESNRILHKLSTDLYKTSEYEKLMMALTSPLPNEQDFAINVCLLMSNEAKHILKLDNCPKLLDFLLAHTGVYYHYSVRELFNEFYTNIRKHSLQSFWDDLLKTNQEILELSYEDFLAETNCYQSIFGEDVSSPLSNEELIRKYFSKESLEKARKTSALRMQDEFCVDDNNICNSLKKNTNISSLDLSLVDHDTDFLLLGRGLGTQDFVGQRILQVISIIRNLSFFDENLMVLAKNRTLIRFLIMASNIRWGSIHQQALDILGNIAPEIELHDPATDVITRCLASTVSDGLLGSDRGAIINCLEILYKLCQFEKNKYYLYKCIQQNIYDQISLYLTLNDIMLLLYTLECIYSLTSLGQRTCNQIIHVKGIVPTLVSLITVEAQTYGPGGCISMRVVETVPGSMINTVTKNIQNIANLQNAGMAIQTPPNNHVRRIIQSPGPQSTPQPGTDTKPALTSEQKEIEQFAISWLNNNFEVVDSIQSCIEVKELYKMYVTANRKLNRTSGISPKQLPNLIKLIFGPKVGPNIIKRTDANNTETTSSFYVNFRLKGNPVGGQIKTTVIAPPSPVATTTIPAVPQQPQSPALSAVATPGTPILNNHKPIESPDNLKDKKVIIRKTKVIKTEENAKENEISNKLLNAVADEGKKLPTQSVIITKTQLVAQRQQKQKEVIQNPPGIQINNTPTKFSSSISQIVTNTLLQSTPVKVGQTTIKPINPHATLLNSNDTKKIQIQLANENTDSNSNWDPVPPLAPLSHGNMVRSLIISAPPSICGTDDSNSSSSNLTPTTICTTMSSKPAATTTPNSILSTDDDSSKDSVKSSQIVNSNQMLVDLLDKKSLDPPASVGIKRRLDCDENTQSPIDESCKRIAIDGTSSPNPVASKNAANLYADLAASILEDEDLDEMPIPVVQKSHSQQIISVPLNVQRQIQVVNSNQTPVIIQKQQAQQVPQTGNTPQYVLATNPQGQTYLLAQQSQQHPPPQAVVVTQTNNQQGGAPTKTIIILQPQNVPQQNSVQMPVPVVGSQQKVIMTTTHGQQVIVSQVPRPMSIQQQIVVNHHNSQKAAAAGVASPPPIIQTSFQGNIPATIKFHSPPIVSTTPPIQGNIVSSSTQIAKPQPQIKQIVMTNDLEATTTAPNKMQQQQQQPPPQQQKNVIMHTIKAAPGTVSTTQPPQLVKASNPVAPPSPANITVKSTTTTSPPNFIVNNSEITQSLTPAPTGPIVQAAPTPTVPCPTLVTSKPSTIQQPTQPAIVPVAPTSATQIPQPAAPVVASQQPVTPSTIVDKVPGTAEDEVDINWPWVCDWKNCPRKKFRSLKDVYKHACTVHCPDNLDPAAEIFCQWGVGSSSCSSSTNGPGGQQQVQSLCDGIPRKRFSLMTHILDRHCTNESFNAAVQRRLAGGIEPCTGQPVTIIKTASSSTSTPTPSSSLFQHEASGTASPTLSISSNSSGAALATAMHAIKRYSSDFQNPKELMDESEGPVTKSIRLTAALILRNLVTHTTSAKKLMRRFEPHLASVALSNVESSGTVSQILFELNN